MKRICLQALMLCAAIGADAQSAQSITIKGTVKFIDPGFKVSVFQRDGTSRKVLAETTVNDDHTYQLQVPVEKPCKATLDCGRWQSVDVWLEDESLDVDFRGKDTARIIVKNPPYVYIKGGKNNELMNLINFETYRNYQAMIAISQAVYRAEIADEKRKSQLSMNLYDASADNYRAHMTWIIKHYSDRNSVMAAISQTGEQDNVIVEAALARLESCSAVSRQLVADYRAAVKAKREAAERMKTGNPVPDFTFQTVEGKSTSLSKYKGKTLVLDFWASWCGPCRKEIPNMKKLYGEYKQKGVEFLSVSIDAKKEAWTKALSEENMAWPQGWTTDAGKAVMEAYQFGGIPFILVIDKDGNLYRKNVRGEGIRNAIEDALAGKKAVEPKQGKTMIMGSAM